MLKAAATLPDPSTSMTLLGEIVRHTGNLSKKRPGQYPGRLKFVIEETG